MSYRINTLLRTGNSSWIIQLLKLLLILAFIVYLDPNTVLIQLKENKKWWQRFVYMRKFGECNWMRQCNWLSTDNLKTYVIFINKLKNGIVSFLNFDSYFNQWSEKNVLYTYYLTCTHSLMAVLEWPFHIWLVVERENVFSTVDWLHLTVYRLHLFYLRCISSLQH